VLSAASFSTRMDNFGEIYANHNELAKIDREFFDIADKLEVAEFEGNVCVDEKFENFAENREENLMKFEECFDDDEETTGGTNESTTEGTTTPGGGSSMWAEFVRFAPVFAGLVGMVLIGI
jgi:hypothetical protein